MAKVQEKSIITSGASMTTVRPPVVVVVGHVDHGKTTLLDYIRKTSVADREAGGITQAVGAYEIERETPPNFPLERGGNRKITFIDTPGHEAFSAMRSRGAKIADLAVLVVSSEDGMKPQTKEALQILNDTKTPFIVAFTKIDKVNGNFDKARNDLMAAGVLLEGFGGQVSFVGVSGKTGEGVNELLDLLLLTAELENLSYDPSAPASGYVLETRRDPRRGIEATLIVKNGVLHRGDLIRMPSAQGKVKILEDFMGKTVAELSPSSPAIVVGFESLPQVGDEFSVVMSGMSSADADAMADRRAVNALHIRTAKQGPRTMSQRAAHLPLILKASDGGSLEALAAVLTGIGGAAEKGLQILESTVGDITDGDVKQAAAMGATIIGFKNRVEKAAQNLAEAQKVRILTSNIVYDLEKAVQEYLTEQFSPIAGELEVLAIFNQTRLNKQLVGGKVTHGIFKPKTSCEILRRTGENAPIVTLGTGKVLTLHEKKSEIFEAEKEKEIGVVIGSSVAIQVGDRLVIKK